MRAGMARTETTEIALANVSMAQFSHSSWRRNTGRRASNFTVATPTTVLTVVATITGPMISVGFEAPAAARIAITVAGMSWTLLVLMTRKVHMASVAVPSFLLSLLSSSIALRPSGVAALARPSMLADMFM